MSSRPSFEVGQVRVLAKTDRAILVDGDCGQVWFPLSEISLDSEIDDKSERDEEGELIVTEWIATEKGLL